MAKDLNVVLVEAGGAPINESAYCDDHTDFADDCYAMALDAEDAPDYVFFSRITAETAENNDTVCVACRMHSEFDEN